ncbi:hypothetical protein J3R82DRAFT_8303 [Butyriboletus roseoflavus]|nr:hypothetical protein J3R82DRAFT_8303 [Butyriboletus roseoflavus]
MKYGNYLEGTALLLIGNWGYVLFLAAADLVMILRVYAIWNRSRVIFGILFFIYAAQTITSLVWNGIYANSNQYSSVTILRVLNFTYCSFSFNKASFSVVYRTIPRFVLSVILLILAVIPTVKEAVETYPFTKHWQINQYMKLLVREGVLYFILTLLFNILSVIRPESPTDLTLVLVTLSYSVSSVIMPRFIISIREWHDRDIWNRGQGIDTAFGVFPQFLASDNGTVSVLGFADVILEEDQTEGNAHDSEAIQLEVIRDGAGQV